MLNELKTFFKTLLCFLIACFLFLLLLLTFVGVHFNNKIINYILDIIYPTLIISKTKKIRTLIDTPHNAGIFNFLLCVKGPCDLQQIKQKYTEYLLEQRDRYGKLKFPKLRQNLITCWGQYAWVKDTSNFNINNHITVSASSYRGRPVNDGNIQEFVSDLVTKYMPKNMPQWQVFVIPTTKQTNTEQESDHHYYILIKVHHLIIAEEKDLHISELLMLQANEPKSYIEILEGHQTPQWQHLSHFVNKPVYIEHLYRTLKHYFVKQWNAFIYEFDSLDSHDGCLATTTVTNLTKLFSLLLIIHVNVCSSYWKWIQLSKTQSIGKISMSLKLYKSEFDRRHLTWPVALAAIRATVHPLNVVSICIKLFITLLMLPIIIPFYISREIIAVICVLFKMKCIFVNTYTPQIINCCTLSGCALWEFMKILYEIFKMPVNIYEELFENLSHQTNILQMKTFFGRKVVAFSKSINAADIRSRNNFDKTIHECDFTLACLAGAIRDYFDLYENKAAIPQILNTTCRTISKAYFTDRKADKMEHIGGVVFLQLPLKTPSYEHAQQIHNIIQNIRRKQTIMYLVSIGQTKCDLITTLLPQVFTKIFINFFAYNFPVTITDIHGPNADFQTIWGQNVEDVLLFRPPQSKTCLSLNLHRFGDRIRLAVMADTNLAPYHPTISQAFETYMENTSL